MYSIYERSVDLSMHIVTIQNVPFFIKSKGNTRNACFLTCQLQKGHLETEEVEEKKSNRGGKFYKQKERQEGKKAVDLRSANSSWTRLPLRKKRAHNTGTQRKQYVRHQGWPLWAAFPTKGSTHGDERTHEQMPNCLSPNQPNRSLFRHTQSVSQARQTTLHPLTTAVVCGCYKARYGLLI